MDAQSQELSPHPLDPQQSCLGNTAICNFILMLLSLQPNIAPSLSKLSSVNSLFFPFPFLLHIFDFQCISFSVTFSACFSFFFCRHALDASRLALLLLLFFFFFSSLLHARCLIKQLQKSKFDFLYLCSHLPLCGSFPCFSISFFLSFFFFFFSFRSPAARTC